MQAIYIVMCDDIFISCELCSYMHNSVRINSKELPIHAYTFSMSCGNNSVVHVCII